MRSALLLSYFLSRNERGGRMMKKRVEDRSLCQLQLDSDPAEERLRGEGMGVSKTKQGQNEREGKQNKGLNWDFLREKVTKRSCANISTPFSVGTRLYLQKREKNMHGEKTICWTDVRASARGVFEVDAISNVGQRATIESVATFFNKKQTPCVDSSQRIHPQMNLEVVWIHVVHGRNKFFFNPQLSHCQLLPLNESLARE